jgi:hypothetical protein
MRIMENPKFIFLTTGILLSGCLFQSRESDPYGGLSCEDKIAKMTRELQAFEAAKKPLAKASFADSVPTVPESGDIIPGDTTRIPDSTRTPIQIFRGDPPVTGVIPETPNPTTLPNDSRPTGAAGNNSGYPFDVQWIPPAGYNETGTTYPGSITVTSPNPEATNPVLLPKNIVTVQIVTTEAYKAHIRILDYKRDLVRELDQEFGYNGELKNPARVAANGLTSYLVWDKLTSSGKPAQDGVYQWNVRFTFKSGLVDDQTVKTGVLGEECESKP